MDDGRIKVIISDEFRLFSEIPHDSADKKANRKKVDRNNDRKQCSHQNGFKGSPDHIWMRLR